MENNSLPLKDFLGDEVCTKKENESFVQHNVQCAEETTEQAGKRAIQKRILKFEEKNEIKQMNTYPNKANRGSSSATKASFAKLV